MPSTKNRVNRNNFTENIIIFKLYKNLKGIICPRQKPLRVIDFADDTAIGLRNFSDTLTFKKLWYQYSQWSNAKINASKTVIIDVGTPVFPMDPIFCNASRNVKFGTLVYGSLQMELT